MFVGMIGYTYLYGLSSIWIMAGFLLGDFTASLFIHKKLRIKSQKNKNLSFAGAISNWYGENNKELQRLLGFLTIIFLGTYAAAQLNAGSKALHVLFGWDYEAGAILGAIMVVLYCFAGGIRASIWTDAAQSFVMILAMSLLVFTSVSNLGGIGNLVFEAKNISPQYSSFFPQSEIYSPIMSIILFAFGWFFSGLSIVGQPHVMIRFMAMDKARNMNKVRIYYYSFYSVFYLMTLIVAICARILLPDVNNFDAELALPTLAQNLLPEILVGVVLAGLFAATMSTADSQILSCSAAITHDFSNKKASYIQTKLATIFVTFVALMIALYGSKNVFQLVIIAWSALGASFGPLLIIYSFKGNPSQKVAILMVLLAIFTMGIWRFFELQDYIHEAVPSLLVGIFVYLLSRIFTGKKTLKETSKASLIN
jgi:sodium/proline symporter